MASVFELNLFQQELEEVKALPEAGRWQLKRDESVPLGILVEMHPRDKSGEVYLARIRWNDYFKPASLKFLTRDTHADCDPNAWPRCRGFRPATLDACVSWTAEGHALHPEWANSPRTAFKVESPLQFVLLQLQHELDFHYQGRGAQ